MTWLGRLWTSLLIRHTQWRRRELLRTRMLLKKGLTDIDEQLKAASLQLVGLRLMRKVSEEPCTSNPPLNCTPTWTPSRLNATAAKSWS